MSTFASIGGANGSIGFGPKAVALGLAKNGIETSFPQYPRLGEFPRSLGKSPRSRWGERPMFGAQNLSKLVLVMKHETRSWK
jgi:hypothetical protein